MKVQNSYYIKNHYANSYEGKVTFKKASFFNPLQTCQFDVQHPIYDKLDINTQFRISGNKFITTVEDFENLKLGKDEFCLYEDEKELYDCIITTEPLYQNKSIGEILRLSSIITLLQNDFQKIHLFSLGDSAGFHYKYKFEPAIELQKPALKMLDLIKSSTDIEAAEQAESILLHYDKSAKGERNLCIETNDLIKKILETNQGKKTRNKKIFSNWALDMELTRDKIIENKKFFNKLFKKHGIEYEIE